MGILKHPVFQGRRIDPRRGVGHSLTETKETNFFSPFYLFYINIYYNNIILIFRSALFLSFFLSLLFSVGGVSLLNRAE